MKNTVLVVWICWWIGQCLCSHDIYSSLQPTPRPHTWRPSPHYRAIRQRTPSQNNTMVARGIPLKENPHPAPGVSEGTYYSINNTTETILSVNRTNNVRSRTSEDSTREDRVSISLSSPVTNIEDPEHSSENFSTADDPTIDKENQGPPKDSHSDSESHSESFFRSTPAQDHNLLDMASNLPTPQNLNAPGESEGGEREGHGRVITGHTDLCSFCLCDAVKRNVFCKHKHTNHDKIHELSLDNRVIPPSAETLHIAGFEMVNVKNNTFSRADLKLRNIHFEDIARLELLPNSFHFSALAEENMEVAVIFTNCMIPEMPQNTITQLVRSEDPRLDINLEETRFLTLRFDGCNITEMRSYALYNARLLYFYMTKTKVEVMEENSVHIDSYVEWIIEKSQLPNMIQKSMCLRAQNIVVFSHNTFQAIGNRSLDILSSSQVLFEFNQVIHLRSEALLGIRPREDARAANIVFLNNTIVKADDNSLLTSKKYPLHERKIIDNKFNIPCNCNVMMTFEKLLGISNTSNYLELATFKAVTEKSLCQVYPNAMSYAIVEGYVAHSCTLPITAIVAGTTVAAVILLLVIVCLVCTKRVQKAREEANYLGECCFSQSFSTLHSNTHNPVSSITSHPSQSWEPTSSLQPWVVAVPEVKTYKETELNVAYEHTEPMRVSLRESFLPEPGPLLDFKCKTQMRSSCPFN